MESKISCDGFSTQKYRDVNKSHQRQHCQHSMVPGNSNAIQQIQYHGTAAASKYHTTYQIHGSNSNYNT